MAGGGITEGIVEEACLGYFQALGYSTLPGPLIGPGGEAEERSSWDQVILIGRLIDAVARINPKLPGSVVEQVVARVLRAESQSAMAENERVHRLLTEGVPVEHRGADGSVRTALAWLVDWDHPEANDWLAVNQLTVVGVKQRRPDVVVFVNGLPLALIELKNPGAEQATIKGAWNQVQTYRDDIPGVFTPNAMCVVSDGMSALMGSFSAGWEHYAPWKTIDRREVVTNKPPLEVLIRGVFEPARFLDLVRSFIVFSDEPAGLVKRVAKYHQYWAVNAAVESTIEASAPDGDRRGGVVWHTQGSGKSIEMLLYAAKVMRSAEMGNPTLVLITDRNDLDDQLYGEVFAPARVLPETPRQAGSRAEMRRLLDRVSGGIIFTTIQKFAPDEKGDPHPLLTDRRNVVVIADEAHRSQYDFLDGYARHLRDALPNATYLGFTGTPIESTDRSTRQVFGDYIDIYDLTRAVEDGATVRIFYESRLAKVSLPEEARRAIDEEVEDVTEGTEADEAEWVKTRWARLEAIVGADDRLDVVARDIVDHWEARRANLLGKAMIVVDEPAHMRRALRADRRAPPRLARPRPDRRPGQGRDDGVGRRPSRLPAPPAPEGDVAGDQGPGQRPRGSAGAGDRAGHVADRLRRSRHAHHVRRQADAGCRPDAGDRPGEPDVPRQAGRAHRRLHRRRPEPAQGAGRVLTIRP